jgi:hypothetical protein
MSLGSNTAGDALPDRPTLASSRRSSRGHGRSASLQVVPGRKLGSPAIGSRNRLSTKKKLLTQIRLYRSKIYHYRVPYRSPCTESIQ